MSRDSHDTESFESFTTPVATQTLISKSFGGPRADHATAEVELGLDSMSIKNDHTIRENERKRVKLNDKSWLSSIFDRVYTLFTKEEKLIYYQLIEQNGTTIRDVGAFPLRYLRDVLHLRNEIYNENINSLAGVDITSLIALKSGLGSEKFNLSDTMKYVLGHCGESENNPVMVLINRSPLRSDTNISMSMNSSLILNVMTLLGISASESSYSQLSPLIDIILNKIHKLKLKESPKLKTLPRHNPLINETVNFPVSENGNQIFMLDVPVTKASSESGTCFDRFKNAWQQQRNKSAVAALIGVSGTGKTRNAMEIARNSRRFLYLAGTGSIDYSYSLSCPLMATRDEIFKDSPLEADELHSCQALFEKEATRLILLYFTTRALVHLAILASDEFYSSYDWLHCQLWQKNHRIFDDIWDASRNLPLDIVVIKNVLVGYFRESQGWIIMDEANRMLGVLENCFSRANSLLPDHQFQLGKTIVEGRSLYHFVSRILPPVLQSDAHAMFLGTEFKLKNIDALYSNQARDKSQLSICVFLDFDYLSAEDVAKYMETYLNISEDVRHSWKFKRACWLLQGRPRHAARWLDSILSYHGNLTDSVEILWEMAEALYNEFTRTMVSEWENVLKSFVLSTNSLTSSGESSLGHTAYKLLESSIFYRPGHVNITTADPSIVSKLGARLMQIVQPNIGTEGLRLTEPVGIEAGWKALSTLYNNDAILFVMEQKAKELVGICNTGSTRGSEMEKLIALAFLRLKRVTKSSHTMLDWPFETPAPKWINKIAIKQIGSLPLILDGREHALWPLSEYGCSELIEIIRKSENITELRHDMDLNHVAILPPTDFGPDVYCRCGRYEMLAGSKMSSVGREAYVQQDETKSNLFTLLKYRGPAIRFQVEWPNCYSIEKSTYLNKLNSIQDSAFISISKQVDDAKLFFGDSVVSILCKYNPASDVAANIVD